MMLIDYSPKSKRFVIECTFAENSQIARLPEKRFMRRTRKWHAPALARNAEYLLEHCRASMTPAAVEVAEKALQRILIRRVPFPAWYDFKTEPYQNQQQALDHVWGLDRFALFMEMGTGKTKTAIDYHSARMMTGQTDCWVILCPNAVRDVWAKNEIPLHCPLGLPTEIVGDLTDAKSRRLVEWARSQDRFAVVVGLESLQQKVRDGKAYNTLAEMLAGRKYGMTIDESHKVKNPDAIRSKNAESLADTAQCINIQTGTPTTRCVLDLYQQFKIMDPNIIGVSDYYAFRSNYAEMGGFENREVVGYKNLEELMGLIKPYTFQCRKEDAVDLPPKVYTMRKTRLSKEQAKLYKQVKQEGAAMIRDMKDQPIAVIVEQVLQQYNALQQIVGGFLNYDQDDGVRASSWIVDPVKNAKIQEVQAILEENPGSRVIVWAKYRNEIAQVVEALDSVDSVVEYHGGLSSAERAESIRRFKDGEARVFVANQQTGSEGLTLNEANLVVYFSNSLQYAQRVQSEDRNHRIGQSQSVTYVDLVAEGTVDESILEAMRFKQDVADYVRSQIDNGHEV